MLRETAEAGVSLTVLPGNRDFLLDPGFAARTGCRLVSGGLRLSLNGRGLRPWAPSEAEGAKSAQRATPTLPERCR